MASLQDQYDEAMFDFTMGRVDEAIAALLGILECDPDHFDARLALGLAYSRQGNFAQAIVEGHKAEKLRPDEPLVHTNLSLFYMKSGDKKTAEHHGLKARIASWKGNMEPPPEAKDTLSAGSAKPPTALPDMPWKTAREENKKDP